MNSIRSRLLTWLLPALIGFILLISFFFYMKWEEEISSSFKSHLQSIIVSISRTINPEEIAWLDAHKNDPDFTASPIYQSLFHKLADINNELPIVDLYIVKIEPVKRGETVLPNEPAGNLNPIYTGENTPFAFRQVVLIDTDPNASHRYDFSETNEASVYTTKKALITPIYYSLSSQERFMTGYAPILNNQGQVLALIGADVNLYLYDKNLGRALAVIVLSSLFTILLAGFAVVFVANKITKPVHELKNAALVLASGEYDEKITVKGPTEIVELSNTLNTMRECLIEHISRLTEYNISQGKVYGEYECGELLQYYLFHKVIEDFSHPRLHIKEIQLPSSASYYGLKLSFNPKMTFEEADEEGFMGIFKMLTQNSTTKKMEIAFDFEKQTLTASTPFTTPLLWSQQLQRLVSQEEMSWQKGDFLFVYNSGLARQFPHPQQLHDWFTKVLKHFARDGFELTTRMLLSELNFVAKKHFHHEDIHILALQFI